MNRNIEKGSKEMQMFSDLFRMWQMIGTVDTTEKYWDEVIALSNYFVKKYESSGDLTNENAYLLLARNFAIAMINTLDDVDKATNKSLENIA